MKIVYTTIVGSKMHGLDTPASDEDVRYITMHSIRHVLSPFKNETIKVRTQNGEDEESWELCHFVKHLTSGNPTCYEVIKSDLYDKGAPYAEKIRSLMPLCYDGVKILMAHCGYAEAQLVRYLRKASVDMKNSDSRMILGTQRQNGELWDYDAIRRIPKSVVAGYRVLAQGEQLLRTGDFITKIRDYSPDLHNKLMSIKMMNSAHIDLDFVNEHLEGIESGIKALKAVYETLNDEAKYSKPDIDGIEEILCELYGVSSEE